MTIPSPEDQVVVPVPEPEADEQEVRIVTKRRSPLARAGCALILIVWFLLLLLPCVIGLLVARGELAIDLGSAPGQQLRVWVISESDQRGLGISSALVVSGENADALCVETTVRYMLWSGEGEPETVYCECYERDGTEAPWRFVDSQPEVCAMPE